MKPLLAFFCAAPGWLCGQSLSLSVPARVEFAHPIPLTVTLTNQTARPISVFTLDDAALTWRVESHVDAQQPETSIRQTNTGGPYGYRSRSGGLHAFTQRQRTPVTLEPGQSVVAAWRLELLTQQPMYHAGLYRIRIAYENELTAEAETRVVFEPARDMPRLIRLVERGDRTTHMLAAGYAAMLTGKPTHALAEWWRRNRERVQFIDGRFQPLVSK